MTNVPLNEAQSKLAEIVHQLAPGDIVTITENDRPVAQIVPVPAVRKRPLRPRPAITGVPRAGSVPGLVVPADFKAPLEELQEYME